MKNNKIKIAVLSFYSGASTRGVETWAENLREKVANTIVISGNGKGFVVLHAIRTFNSWRHADVIVPTNGRLQTACCRAAALLLRKKLVVFGHAGPGADDRWNLLCSPHVFVAFSASQQRWAEKHKLPWTHIRLIPHAVDTEVFVPAKHKPKKKIVICVAANTKDKRVDLVRRAVKLLPGFIFRNIGEGGETQVNYIDMPGEYQKADIFCFVPQPWEAFGLVFLEALATNLPVVTINDPVRKEIVGSAGIFVDKPEDAVALSNAILEAYHINWKNLPRKQAEKRSWASVTPKYNELFTELI
ncbi:glycosyltransferase [Candidatus Microgenomates bacterium]|nr:MAG: glycosyltransferase [Candidatus Microgenomates bacterium]